MAHPLTRPGQPLPEFAWRRSDTEAAPSTGTEALLSRHARSKIMGFKQATGGVLPVCADDARQAWCLLGENHRGELCHFHGWVERGETFEMGAAREAHEESRGVLGDALTLWRAITSPSHSRRCGAIVLLSLGTMTQAARDAVCDDFLARPVLYRGMAEVRHVLPSLSFCNILRMCVTSFAHCLFVTSCACASRVVGAHAGAARRVHRLGQRGCPGSC